jgi:hypothetical protein
MRIIDRKKVRERFKQRPKKKKDRMKKIDRMRVKKSVTNLKKWRKKETN